MTPEYQAILLNQLVGTVEEQQGSNEPQFSDATITTTSLATYISDAGHTGNLQFRFYVSRNNYFLLFYNEYDSSNNWKASFVVVTDEALNPIDIIESYYSGTHFTGFQQGSRNDTGEGRIFFISQNRLYYVNDPTAKSPSQPFEMRILNDVLIFRFMSGNLFEPNPLDIREEAIGIAIYFERINGMKEVMHEVLEALKNA